MLSKLILVGLFGTSVVGGGAATGITPTGVELAAGQVRIESGNGKIFNARLTAESSVALTINLKNDQSIHFKF